MKNDLPGVPLPPAARGGARARGLASWKAPAPGVVALLLGYGFCKRGTAGGGGKGGGGFGRGGVRGQGLFFFRRFFLAFWTPDDENVANALDGRGFEPGADFGKQRPAFFALYPLKAYLDEFVRLQRTLQFGKHALGEAVTGNGDDGMQAMGAGA